MYLLNSRRNPNDFHRTLCTIIPLLIFYDTIKERKIKSFVRFLLIGNICKDILYLIIAFQSYYVTFAIDDIYIIEKIRATNINKLFAETVTFCKG